MINKLFFYLLFKFFAFFKCQTYDYSGDVTGFEASYSQLESLEQGGIDSL